MSAVRCLAMGLAVLTALASSAQQPSTTLPPAPDVSLNAHLTLASNASEIHFGTYATGAAFIAPAPPARPRTADSKFLLLNGIHLGMAVLDVEMTQRCLASHQCRETNPVMPSSQAGQLSVNFAVFAFSSGASYWLKKHDSEVWWIPPAFGTAVHAAGAATGFEHQ